MPTVSELWTERRAWQDENGYSHYVRTWVVRTDSKNDGPLAIATIPGFPYIGMPYMDRDGRSDPYARCIRLEANPQKDTPLRWTVVAEWSNEPPKSTRTERMTPAAQQGGRIADGYGGATAGGGPASPPPPQQQMPQFQPVEISWDSEIRQVGIYTAYECDDDGNVWEDKGPIRNSAGHLMEPIQDEETILILNVARPEIIFNPLIILAFTGATNTDTWLGCTPGQVKCRKIRAQGKIDNNFFYWYVSYQFAFRERKWWSEVLDCGPFYLANGFKMPNMDDAGNLIDGPVLLDGNGGKLADNAPPVYKKYLLKVGQPFRNLGL